MGMRTVNDKGSGNICDPYDGRQHATLIDKMIGNAYEVVKYVARHLNEIKYVALNMALVNTVAEELRKASVVVSNVGGLGATVVLPFPDQATVDNVVASSVLVKLANGVLLGSDSGIFTTAIAANGISITLKSDAPAEAVGGQVRWFLTYGV